MLTFLVLGFLKNLCHFVCKVSGSYIKFKRVKLYESYLLYTYLYMQLNSDRQSRLPEYFGMCQHDIFGMCHLHFPRSSKVRPLCMTREHRRTVRKSRLDLPQVLEQLSGWTNPARAPVRTNTSCDYYFVKRRSKSYNLSYPISLKYLWAGLRDLCHTVWSIN